RVVAAPDLPVLRIGLFLPAQGEDGAEAQAISRGARLAADRLNAGSRALRIEITERPADGQWAAGSRELVALAYEQGATAVVGGRPGAAGRLVAALDAAHSTMLLLGPSRLACVEFVRAAGTSAPGVRILAPATSPGPAAPRREAQRFDDTYRTAYGDVPPPLAAVAADAVEVLAAAAARAGVSARAMVPALRGTSHPGLSGIVRFDEAGNRLGEAPWLAVQ